MDMVHHAFHHYDTRVQFNGHNFVQTNDHGDRVDAADANEGGGAGANRTEACANNHVGGAPSTSGSPPLSSPGDFQSIPDPLANPHNADTSLGDAGGPLEDHYEDIEEEALEDEDTSANEEGSLSEEVLEEYARLRLFPGSQLSCLSTTLLLLNCCRTHGCSTTFIDELFKLLSKSVLPTANSLPTSEYTASKKLKELGLSYNSIHACPNSCMLFRGEDENLTHCNKCAAPRYRQCGQSLVPIRVLRHFPLLPRIRRMFSTPLQASFMSWHRHYSSTDGKMRFASDSPQWKEIDKDWPDFAAEPRNLRFGLATDGVNPFSVKRSTWSTWPVMLFNYNVPPWMTTKKHFIILSLIIPGPKAITGEHFDIFVQPLLEEFQYGWSTGVRVNDASNYLGRPNFDCRILCIWTIHDFPALGIVAGKVTKGYVGCPCCGPGTISRRSKYLKKNCYDFCHRRWLDMNHPFRYNSVAWGRLRPEFLASGGMPESATPADYYGGVELEAAPERPTSAQEIAWGRLREEFIAAGATPEHADPARVYGIKRIPSFSSLPYWQVSKIWLPWLIFQRSGVLKSMTM
jgi:hypothetical protein